MNTEQKEADDPGEDSPNRTESQDEWLEQRTPPEWELVTDEYLRPVLQRGDQRVRVDLIENCATWEERVETAPKSVIRSIGDNDDNGNTSSHRSTAETERWVKRDYDEYERICPLVVGRIWRFEDRIVADDNEP